jgi:predicted metalloprotease with PDZ domain
VSRLPALPCWATLLVAAFATAARAEVASGPITLAVDATEAPKKIFHVKETVPVSPGPISLSYPKWLPGEHGPTGPVTDLAGLHITAKGKAVEWERDPVDMYAVQLRAPEGARELEVSFDFLSAAAPTGFSSAASCTQELMLHSWNQTLLYPSGVASDALTYHASLKLPAGWKYGTALPVSSESGGVIRFAPASLTTLVDSPVLAGSNFRRVDLAPGATPHEYLDMACDSRAGLAIADDQVRNMRQLMAEAYALFGARHFREYHFLLSLSDYVAHFGLEHHESSDDRSWEEMWTDDDKRISSSNLLSHELVHSWNGKYRRPAGLATPDYQEPMKGELLWVYEGLTQYLGFVLAARSGVRTAQQARESLALSSAVLDNEPGRTWRPLVDTAVEAQLLYNAAEEYDSWRRGTDFYDEGLLIWLEADATIRKLTGEKRSLDDFCQRFHGKPDSGPKIVPYTYEDVVKAMNEVAPYDWNAFFQERLHSLSPHAPLAGIENSGWKIVYVDSLPPYQKARASAREEIDLRFSLGMMLKEKDGEIRDVIPGTPAAKAGIAPGTKLVAVNGRHWSKDVLLDGVRASRDGGPLELLVDNGEFYKTCKLEYRGGPRYPQLARGSGPDRLSAILKPHAPPVKAAKK